MTSLRNREGGLEPRAASTSMLTAGLPTAATSAACTVSIATPGKILQCTIRSADCGKALRALPPESMVGTQVVHSTCASCG